MQKAIFLDRDGVINSDIGHYYIYKPNDFVLNKGLVESLIKLQKLGFIFIVISNQGGIAKGIYTKEDVELVHDKFQKLMDDNGILIKEIYYCPHHNSIEKCNCRKPDSLNIEKAIARFQIDRAGSFFIGDNESDIRAAQKAGIKGLKINSNQNISSILNQING